MKLAIVTSIGLCGCGLVTVNGKPLGTGGGEAAAPSGGGGGGGSTKIEAAPSSNATCPDGKRYGFAVPDPMSAHKAVSVAIGDVNGDGRGDLVVGTHERPGGPFFNTLRAYLDGAGEAVTSGYGTEAEWSEAESIILGDVDGDGKTDLVGVSKENVSGKPAYALGKGDGSFGMTKSFGGAGNQFSQSGEAAMADLNGDKKIDVVVPPNIFLNTGKGKFMPALMDKNYNRKAAVIADFNNDGAPDIVTMGNPEVLVWMNDGNGSFAEATKIGTSEDTHWLVAGDFNLDGKQDIAVGGKSLQLYWNKGGSFDEAQFVPLGGPDKITMMVTTDLNGDKYPDLVANTYSSYGSNDPAIVFMNNKGKFGKPIVIPIPKAYKIAAGKLGNDKVASLAVIERESTDGSMYIVRGTCR